MSAMAVTSPSFQNPSIEEQTLAQLCHYETLNNQEKPCASCVMSQILQALIQNTIWPQNNDFQTSCPSAANIDFIAGMYFDFFLSCASCVISQIPQSLIQNTEFRLNFCFKRTIFKTTISKQRFSKLKNKLKFKQAARPQQTLTFIAGMYFAFFLSLYLPSSQCKSLQSTFDHIP